MSNHRPPSSGDNLAEETSEFDAPTQAGASGAVSDDATLPPDANGTAGRKREADESNFVGTHFGDYEIVSEIARGGMGVIYKARQQSLDRIVALKMILSGQFASEDEIRRFNAESTAAAQLDHPNIVPIYDSGVRGENHFFSMKLIEGQDLGREMGRLRSDLRSGVALIEKICRAIFHAHQRGILHRDLKPANILLDHDGEPYLTDLGLARHVGSDNQLTRTGAVVGTPSYMPPEQASGSPDITTAVDIYSLGAILYELLAGKPPFQSDNVMATLMQVINESPESPSLSGVTDRNLEMVAMKCLSKSPTERYPTAEALADDLGRWLNGEPVSVRAPSFAIVARNWLRQNFGHAIWILIIGVVAGTLAGLGLWFATVQQEMGDIRSVYDEMPSVDAPATIASWSTPGWAVIPSMVVFTSAVMFIGYLTAALARTKNRSADLAAGIMVGAIAAGAAFFICFGTLCVVAMGFGNQDIALVVRAGAVPDGEMSPDLQQLLDDYPELEPMSRAEQTSMILRKIESDYLYQARNGIAMGTLSCLILFLTAGVVQTLLAGPIVRSCPNLGMALARYVFRAYPFVVATVVLGVHATGIVVLGNAGIIWNWLAIVTFLCLGLGMCAELRGWHWGIRLPLVILIAFLFAGFFAFSFSMMPVVAQSSVEVKKRLRLAERHPDNVRLKDRAAYAILAAGVRLFNGGYYPQADQRFIQALEYLDSIPASLWNDALQQEWRTAILNRVNTLQQMDHTEDAKEVLGQALAKHPQDFQLRLKAIEFLTRNSQQRQAEEVFGGVQVTTNVQWNDLRDLLRVAQSDATLAELRDRLDQVLQRSPLDDAIKSQVNASIEVTQSWRLLGPIKIADRSAVEDKLVKIDVADQLAAVPTQELDSQPIKTMDLRGVNLQEQLGELENVSCFALGFVEVESNQTVDLYLGSDDYASVWVNGELLQRSKGEGRAFRYREDHIPCQLIAGSNVILLRIDQIGGRWQFALHLDAENGWPLPVKWLEP